MGEIVVPGTFGWKAFIVVDVALNIEVSAVTRYIGR